MDDSSDASTTWNAALFDTLGRNQLGWLSASLVTFGLSWFLDPERSIHHRLGLGRLQTVLGIAFVILFVLNLLTIDGRLLMLWITGSMILLLLMQFSCLVGRAYGYFGGRNPSYSANRLMRHGFFVLLTALFFAGLSALVRH